MNPREKLALQKGIREGLESLKDVSMSVRDKLGVQKKIRENLIQLGTEVKGEQPDAATPTFDRLVAGTLELNESNAADILQQIYDELVDAGNDESIAISMLKEPLKVFMLKNGVIQEGVDIDPIIDNFLNLFKSEPEQDILAEQIEENPIHPEDATLFTEYLVEEGVNIEDAVLVFGGTIIEENIFMPPRPMISRPNPSLAEKGIFFLNQDISDESVFPIIQEIMKQNTLKPEDRLKEIKVIVASNGGSVEAAFSFIDVANTSAIPIHTVAMGKVKSAGLLISMSGSPGHRSIFPNTSVLSHQFSWGMRGNESSMHATAVEVQNLGKRLHDHYKACTGLSDAKIKKELMPATDRWLTAQQAIEFHLFDKIETGEIYQSSDQPTEKPSEAKDTDIKEGIDDGEIEFYEESGSDNDHEQSTVIEEPEESTV
jgi:ATP-dependent Clp protease, protease subunit